MALNDTVQLAVIGKASSQQHIHTLHFRLIDPTGVNTEQALIDDWQGSVRGAYRQLFQTGDTPCELYRASHVCGAVPLRAPVEEAEVAPNIVGAHGAGGDRAPSWLAGVISWRTQFAGRSRRGRNFFGGLWEVQMAGNELTDGYYGDLVAYKDALLARYGPEATSLVARLVVHSHKLAQPGVECQNSSTLITSGIVRREVCSMRSRRAGHGN